MVYSQKRNWGYNEHGDWDSVQGQELPEGWTHDDPNAKKEEVKKPEPVEVEVSEKPKKKGK